MEKGLEGKPCEEKLRSSGLVQPGEEKTDRRHGALQYLHLGKRSGRH